MTYLRLLVTLATLAICVTLIWSGALLHFIEWLIRRREIRALRERTIDPNHKCPGCGAFQGKLKITTVQTDNGGIETQIEHQCQVCSAKWYEDTLIPGKEWVGQQNPRIKRIGHSANEEHPFSPGK